MGDLWRRLAGGLLGAALLAACGAGQAPPPPAPAPAGQPTPAPGDGALPAALEGVSVAFWDEGHGLLAGTTGCTPACTGVLARTDDGGKSWQVLQRGGPAPGSLSVSGSADAWGFTSDCSGPGGCATALQVSHDGGRTWATVARDVTAPSFVSDRVGWALRSLSDGRPGLLATRDGGKSWTELPQPCTGQPWSPGGLHFADAAHGWLLCTGQPGAGNQAKAVYATADGGKSWTEAVAVPFAAGVVNGLPRSGYASGLFFLADGHGWLWEARGGLFASADGGKHWQGLLTAQPESIEVSAAWFLTPDVGYLLRRNMAQGRTELLLTRDGGQSGTVLQSWRRPG